MVKESISVILPAFNESENIEEAVTSAFSFLKKTFKKFEIIVVEDGSTDDTFNKLKKLQKQKLLNTIIHHSRNLGYGATLRDGFKSAKNNLIFYTDADNQFNIAEITNLLPLIERYDVVSAYRIHRADPLSRIFIAFVYNTLLHMLFDIPVKDIDASFKLYKKKIFKNMTLHSQTGLIDAEILIKAKKQGFTIGQIGVTHYPRKNGRTIYEIGKRNSIIALVKPHVIADIFKEIKTLWPELR